MIIALNQHFEEQHIQYNYALIICVIFLGQKNCTGIPRNQCIQGQCIEASLHLNFIQSKGVKRALCSILLTKYLSNQEE
jgi:hypothetical protein